MNRRREPLVVAVGVIFDETKILVGQRRKNDRHAYKWEFPGGKVESGETPQQALVRELREELRIDASVGRELARYEFDYPNGHSVHLLFFAVAAYRGELKAQAFEQIAWVAKDELAQIDFLDGDVDFVRRLSRGEFN